MKRTTLISASLLLAFAGCTCGQGWRPNIFSRLSNRFHGVSNVGATCDAGCDGGMAAPISAPISGGCESCGSNVGANYGGYETVGDSYEVPNLYQSQVVPQYTNGSTTTLPPGSYQTGPATTSSRMEPIAARANK
jgi:hypothetical protein